MQIIYMPSTEYLRYIKDYTLIHFILFFIPLLAWTWIIRKYLLIDKRFTGAFGTVPLLLFPYLIIIYNWYTVAKNKGVSMTPSWGYCNDVDPPSHMKDSGVVNVLDVECSVNDNDVAVQQGQLIANRFYYINYVILFVIVIVYNNISHVFDKNKRLLKIIALAAGLSMFGSIASLFSDAGVYSMFIQRFVAGFLNMNIAVVLMLLVYIFHRIYGAERLFANINYKKAWNSLRSF